jgi:hypothetical protein
MINQPSLFFNKSISYNNFLMLRNDFSNKTLCSILKEKTLDLQGSLTIDDSFNISALKEILPYIAGLQILFIQIIPKYCKNTEKTFFYLKLKFTFGEIIINKKWYIYDASSSLSIIIELLSPIFMVGLENKIVFDGGFANFRDPMDIFAKLSRFATGNNPYQFLFNDEAPHFVLNGNNILHNASKIYRKNPNICELNNSEFKKLIKKMNKDFYSKFLN